MNNTITVQRKTEQVQSVSIPVPYYAKDGMDFYAITSEETGLRVFILNNHATIISFKAADLPAKHEQISESAFIGAYNRAKIIQSGHLNPSPVEAVTA